MTIRRNKDNLYQRTQKMQHHKVQKMMTGQKEKHYKEQAARMKTALNTVNKSAKIVSTMGVSCATNGLENSRVEHKRRKEVLKRRIAEESSLQKSHQSLESTHIHKFNPLLNTTIASVEDSPGPRPVKKLTQT